MYTSSRLVFVFLSCLISTMTTPVLAQSSSGMTPVQPGDPGLPPDVPSNYVVTPDGFFSPDCIIVVQDGDVLNTNGTIERANGRIDALPVCPHPYFTFDGTRIDSTTSQSATATTCGTINNLQYKLAATAELSPAASAAGSSLVVPQTPTNIGGPPPANNPYVQLAFWTGLQAFCNPSPVLQPVVGWNWFADEKWTIFGASCCINLNFAHSPPQEVHPGDSIVLGITAKCSQSGGCCTGPTCGCPSGVCPTWAVTATDVTMQIASTLPMADGNGQVFNWFLGAVLEQGGVQNCQNYPPGGSTIFSTLGVREMNPSGLPTPVTAFGHWKKWIFGTSPSCGFAISVPADNVAGNITLTY
jgi:hypothetical protein